MFSEDLKGKLCTIRDDLHVSGETSLDWKDFLMGTMDQGLVLREDKIRNAFDHLKKASTSNISISDLNEAFQGEEVAEEILGDVDSDGDGQISYTEFRNVLLSDKDEQDAK